ncbi:MAG: AMP-binding protein [Paracoccus sp. (in: a-proteobacteria)]|nr:AMP-binding protein [Paracoccus sp. (in: a-proteobacteria)]
MMIRSIDDIRALEARPYAEVFPERTPYDIISRSAARWPDRIALRHVSGGSVHDLSYGAFLGRIHRAANLFRSLGCVAGKSVAIIGPHTPSMQIALWAAQLAGRACPINPMLRPSHIAGLLRAADAALVVALGPNDETEIWDALVPALRQEGFSGPILDADADRPAPGSDGRFETLLDGQQADLSFAPEGDETAIAAYYHTGGTTGAPKLVRHTRRCEAHVARSCAMMHDLRPEDVVLNGFPLFHVAGAFVYGLSSLSAGAQIVIPGRLGMRDAGFVDAIWRNIARFDISVMAAVPTFLARLSAIERDCETPSLRAFLTGGSPLPTELADRIERLTGCKVRNILGMTECAGAISLEPVHAARTPGSCGLRLPFSEVAALGDDLAPEHPLPPGETGVIALRGPNVADGYSDPSLGAGTFIAGGWLVSGDLGHVDAEGRVFVTGRAKDVIIRGAHNIDPQTIESALLRHEAVRDAAAVGMPDAYAGELPVAFVTLRPGGVADGAGLIAFLRDQIDEQAALPKRVEIIEALPLTPVGKVFKPALRAEATSWAISAALEALGPAGAALSFEVEETGAVRLTGPAAALDAARGALAGMPIAISYEEGAA